VSACGNRDDVIGEEVSAYSYSVTVRHTTLAATLYSLPYVLYDPVRAYPFESARSRKETRRRSSLVLALACHYSKVYAGGFGIYGSVLQCLYV
jgi:hypothetical protein